MWVDQALLDALKLHVGDTVKVGNRSFTIGAVITRELDRGFSFVNFSPRLMLRADEVQSTGLITFGSRVTYRLLVAGADASVARFAQFAHDKVDGGKMRGVALESLQDGQPQVRQTLDRASHFLTLVSLLTALLAAVAIAMAAHRYMRRHLDGCAAMRCLGVSQAALRALFTLEFVGLGLIGGALGVALGFLGHLALLTWLGTLIDVALPYPTVWPALEGIAAGLVLLLGFALPPLLPLTRVPPVRVLRREWGEAGRTAWAAYALGIVLFAALLIVAAGELKLGGIVAGGFAGGLLVFACIARLALWGAARFVRSERVNAGIGWRYALASLERRSSASALQITALGIGLMCLLLIAMTRNDLVAGWRKSTPPDAPNEFIIDIQPDQRDAVTHYLDAHGVPGTVLAPMVRGRLIAINGKPVNPDSFKGDDAKRLVDREFNLSYTTELPDDNRIAAGNWYGDDEHAADFDRAGARQADQREARRHAAFRRDRLADRRAGDERAQARLGFVQGQLFRADAARRVAGFSGDVHHELPFAAGKAVDHRRPDRRLSEPHRDRHRSDPRADPARVAAGDRRGAVPVRVHARGGRAGAVRGACRHAR